MQTTPTLGPCSCRRGRERDNCPQCEGTGNRIDFRAWHRNKPKPAPTITITDNPGTDPEFPRAKFPAALLVQDAGNPLALRWAFFVSTEAAETFKAELLKEVAP